MKSKTLFYITWISMACTLAAYLIRSFAPTLLEVQFPIVSVIFTLCGTGLLLDNGTFNKSTYYRWTGIAIPLIIFGMLFKIMHWPGSLILLLTGFAFLSLLYVLHFLSKTNKDQLSSVKLLFVLTFCISKFFTFIRLPYNDIIELLPLVILAYAIFLFTFPPAHTEAPDVLD
ncbi:MAG: hypothetical protein H7282_05495 [Cytophagaceae bacterium]|nr:hypothetical protein [Cytophagaceae bacterium]